MNTVYSTAPPSQVIQRATPPIATPARPSVEKRSYRNLVAMLALNPNLWFTVLPEGIAGKDLLDKRRCLIRAARMRGHRLQTTIQDATLFVRVVVDAEVVR